MIRNRTLEVIDAEENYLYEIISVTEDEYNKAQEDPLFATKLLEANKYPAEKENVSENLLPPPTQNENNDIPSLPSSSHHFLWTDNATKLFISTYKNLTKNGENQFKKSSWDKLSLEMNKNGYLVTAKQCNTKMDSPKRQYKLIRDHNNKSGNSRKDWRYLDMMDEIFGKRAWANPLSTISSLPIDEDVEADDALGQPPPKRQKLEKGQRDTTTSLQTMMQLKKDELEARQLRHREKMDRLDRLNNLLEEFIKK